jgi:hypothetical protein
MCHHNDFEQKSTIWHIHVSICLVEWSNLCSLHSIDMDSRWPSTMDFKSSKLMKHYLRPYVRFMWCTNDTHMTSRHVQPPIRAIKNKTASLNVSYMSRLTGVMTMEVTLCLYLWENERYFWKHEKSHSWTWWDGYGSRSGSVDNGDGVSTCYWCVCVVWVGGVECRMVWGCRGGVILRTHILGSGQDLWWTPHAKRALPLIFVPDLVVSRNTLRVCRVLARFVYDLHVSAGFEYQNHTKCGTYPGVWPTLKMSRDNRWCSGFRVIKEHVGII